ncbi:SRPBCC family protein [Muricauda sp. 334s03]|uniref:SRPBCC family protein n=1 Tax=Flagellimonas yonaguniensis TaxID=3031325 RepID=A0ABT5Y5S4_9FLAO|nr:SRPBCC family protein [[Muricauda] yonaguniensis]MDF0718347.1 SRPBCC family protein [[Muricauda] yonaguniensis]
MPRIELKTEIEARKEIVFDLSRSIDLHKISIEHTNEEAIGGKTSGLIGTGEWVTWRAKHFGVYQKLTSKITDFYRPDFFADEMVNGAFKSFRHEHHFKESNGGTLITDYFDYKSPFGLLGNLADNIFLKNYMKVLLEKRNRTIKEFAESKRWKEVIKNKSSIKR